MPRIHLIIRGRVQGVFFRASAQELADSLRLVGWVRNRHDGAVEIVAEGGAASLTHLGGWARRGPPGAFVEDVEEISEAETGEFRTFGVRG
jgi:acylphosphatase